MGILSARAVNVVIHQSLSLPDKEEPPEVATADLVTGTVLHAVTWFMPLVSLAASVILPR